MAMTNSEKNAVVAKLEAPGKRVICPRCGSELKYYKFDFFEYLICILILSYYNPESDVQF